MPEKTGERLKKLAKIELAEVPKEVAAEVRGTERAGTGRFEVVYRREGCARGAVNDLS